MTKEIIIRGSFDIEGIPLKNIAFPLKYAKIKIGREPDVFLEEFSTLDERRKKVKPKALTENDVINWVEKDGTIVKIKVGTLFNILKVLITKKK